MSEATPGYERRPAATIQERLGRPFDPAELRRIKRLWVRHSIAEERRDVDGLIATLAEGCAYEIIPTGQRWDGHAGARTFYEELFAAFPITPSPSRRSWSGRRGSWRSRR